MTMFALPKHPSDTNWPTEHWPEASQLSGFDDNALQALLDHAFTDPASETLGETHAFLAVHRGQVVAERYWRAFSASDTQPSWSMAKSITHALIGLLVRDGKIDIHAPADVPEWQGMGDLRKEITLDQLLRMSSGLKFTEDYVDAGVSDVIEMLFGEGKDDVAAFAAGFPAEHVPDKVWSYSSGTTNIIARCAARAIGKTGEAFEAYMRDELFTTLGMASPLPKFDAAGTFIGSSFCYCTPRDFARFGLLYMRDGVWDGKRLLPEGWADYARTPTPTPDDEPLDYGAQWWLGLCGEGSFSANGYQGQYTALIPALDLILIRNGNSTIEQCDQVRVWLSQITDCFRT